MKFKIQTENFEGPLDLLLELIEKRKLFINDVSLAKVADDYISHVENMDSFSVPDTAHFILVASTLLLIKSKSLLPQLELTEDEQSDVEDLERRLRLYKRTRQLSTHVKTRFGNNVMLPREDTVYEGTVFMPEESLNTSTIAEAARSIISSFPKVEVLARAVVDKVMSLEEMIGQLTERIQKSITMSFSEFSNGKGSSEPKTVKVNVIISFLAMLELVKQGVIAVQQTARFTDIKMETKDSSVPNYT